MSGALFIVQGKLRTPDGDVYPVEIPVYVPGEARLSDILERARMESGGILPGCTLLEGVPMEVYLAEPDRKGEG